MNIKDTITLLRKRLSEVNAFQPKKAEESFGMYLTAEPISIQELYSRHLRKCYEHIISASHSHLETVLEIPSWFTEDLKTRMVEDITKYGYKILYQDAHNLLISWRF